MNGNKYVPNAAAARLKNQTQSLAAKSSSRRANSDQERPKWDDVQEDENWFEIENVDRPFHLIFGCLEHALDLAGSIGVGLLSFSRSPFLEHDSVERHARQRSGRVENPGDQGRQAQAC